MILKVVNPTPVRVPATLNFNGRIASQAKGRVVTLSHADPHAENSLDHPDVVVPVEAEFALAGPRLTYTFAPDSFTILRIPLSAK